MSTDAANVEEHLRAASDAILLLIGEVSQLEQHKRGVAPGDSRFSQLAESVRAAADDLAKFAAQEEAWARGAAAAHTRLATIQESASPPPMREILARWRAVERELNEAPPGSPEAEALFEEFLRIRDEYMAAFQDRSGADEHD